MWNPSMSTSAAASSASKDGTCSAIYAELLRASAHPHARPFDLEVRIDPDCHLRPQSQRLASIRPPGAPRAQTPARRSRRRQRLA